MRNVIGLMATMLLLSACDLLPKTNEQLAFAACQKMVALEAKNPSSAVVPKVKGERHKAMWQFKWKHGDGLRFQNAYGAMIDQTAECHAIGENVVQLNVGGMVRLGGMHPNGSIYEDPAKNGSE